MIGEGGDEPYTAACKLTEEQRNPGSEKLELGNSGLSLGAISGQEK